MQKINLFLENISLQLYIIGGIFLFLIIYYGIFFLYYIYKNRAWLIPQKPKYWTKEREEKTVRDVVRKISMRDSC
jgi:hypothetical protein